jgi:hypothetical protein
MAGVVQAPAEEAPQYGLIASAQAPPPGEDPATWARGFSWRPETCGGYSVISQCSTAEIDPPEPGPGLVEYTPWAVIVQDACSTLSGRADVEGKLRRAVLGRQSHAVARELWEGALTEADDLGNAYLTEADSSDRPLNVLAGGTALKPAVAVGLLEEALGDCLHGSRGMIHTPLSVAEQFPGLTQSGARWVTRAGNLMVADAGYSGTAPAEATPADEDSTRWVIATGPVTVRLHPEITVLPTDDSSGGVRISDNRRLYRAERLVAATYDPCCRVAVHVDLTA